MFAAHFVDVFSAYAWKMQQQQQQHGVMMTQSRSRCAVWLRAVSGHGLLDL